MSTKLLKDDMLLSDDPWVREIALKEIIDSGALSVLKKHVKKLLSFKDPKTRILVLQNIDVDWIDDEVFLRLKEILLTSSDGQELNTTVFLLLKACKDKKIDKNFWKKLFNSSVLERRFAALRIVPLVEDFPWEILDDALIFSDYGYQRAMFDAVPLLDTKYAKHILLTLLKSPHWDIRAEVAEVAAKMKLDMPDYFWRTLFSDRDIRVRKRTARALIESDLLLESVAEWIRKHKNLAVPELLQLMGKWDLPGCRLYIASFLEDGTPRELLETAVKVLADLKEKAVIERVFELLLDKQIGYKVGIYYLEKLIPDSACKIKDIVSVSKDEITKICAVKLFDRLDDKGCIDILIKEYHNTESKRYKLNLLTVISKLDDGSFIYKVWQSGDVFQKAIVLPYLLVKKPEKEPFIIEETLSGLNPVLIRILLKSLPFGKKHLVFEKLISLDNPVLKSMGWFWKLTMLLEEGKKSEFKTALKNCLHDSTSEVLRVALCFVKKLGFRDFKDDVWQLVRHADEDVVIEAINTIGYIGDSDDILYLKDIIAFWKQNMGKVAHEAIIRISMRVGAEKN